MEVLNKNNMLKGKNSIITGCARGIGKGILELFAENGSNIIWACARKKTPDFEKYLHNLSKKNNVIIKPVYFDLSNKDEIKSAVKTIMSDKKKVDVLVNNAGITYNALFQMSTLDMINKVMDINFTSQFIFTQYIVKLMLRNGSGSIINISSTAAIDANSGRSVYGASKAALLCATKALASELGDSGIRANVVAPGITKTDMIVSMSEEVIQETIDDTDIKRIGNPNDIANTVMFLASEHSSYITGQVIRVDGGLQ